MEKHEKLRIFAGILLITSAITHVSQIFVHGTEIHTIFAALFGLLYGILGVLIIYLRQKKIIAILGGTLPFIGGILGIRRLFLFFILVSGEINYFIIFHVIVDIIVIPICWYDFMKLRQNSAAIED